MLDQFRTVKASTLPLTAVSVLADRNLKVMQISVTGQQAYCLVFGSKIKFSPAHPQLANVTL